MSTTGQTALILGATGQVGQLILKELLSSPHFTKVGEFGRRVTAIESIPADKGRDKLVQKTVDFEKVEDAGMKEGKWDVVFIALGTSKAEAGSAEAFERIDREYVINGARAAKVEDTPQRLVYISSVGANPTSPLLYARSKGLTEQGLAGLGYADTIVFRPAFLAGVQRPKSRLAETIAGVFTGIASHFTATAEIQISTLAKSAVLAGRLGSSSLPAAASATKAGKSGEEFTLIVNSGAIGMAKDA